MSDEIWSSGADHPPLSVLLLHVEGELEGDEAARATAHVTHCRECRTECEHLRQGIFQFMEYQATEPLPPPPSGSGVFRQRLAQAAVEASTRQDQPSYVARVMAGFTQRWRITLAQHWRVTLAQHWRVVTSAAAVTLIAVVFLTMSSHNIAAGEVLENAVVASKAAHQLRPGRAVYEKVRIRRGNVSFERTVSHGPGMNTAVAEPIDPVAQQIMTSARINWSDPLNAADFSDWRAEQHSKRDKVGQTSDAITVDTISFDNGPVREASLTVERDNWRTIRRHVETREGEPLDITEVSFEIREVPPVPRVETSKLSAVPEPLPFSGAPREATPQGPTSEQLEDAELRLREALHASGADVQDSPVIWKDTNRVYFRIYPESPQHGDQVRQAVGNIPLVLEAPADRPFPAAVHTDEVQQLTSPFTTIPPLADDLAKSLGGLDSANKYLASVRDRYVRLLTVSTALQRLGQRYSPEAVRGLSPENRLRVTALTTDYLNQINRDTSSWLQELSPVLRDMMQLQDLAPSATSAGSSAGSIGTCLPWQNASGEIVTDAQALNTAFMELFVQEQVEKPTQLNAGVMLRNSEQTSIALRNVLNSVCGMH